MSVEGIFPTKPHPTEAAGVRLLPRVRGEVVPQRGPLPEPLPADAAGVRPLVRVGPHVILQVAPAIEAPPTQLARVPPVPRVVPLVQPELGPVPQGLSTRRGSAGSCRQGGPGGSGTPRLRHHVN